MRASFSCFLSYSNKILPGSGQFTFTRELSNDCCVLLTNLTCFMTFVALQNTLILPHSCRNQPWSPFVTQTSQPVCIPWTTCKVSLVGPAYITLEKVNWKRYARAEGHHTKMAIPWQIQGACLVSRGDFQWVNTRIKLKEQCSMKFYQYVFPAIYSLAWGKS